MVKGGAYSSNAAVMGNNNGSAHLVLLDISSILGKILKMGKYKFTPNLFERFTTWYFLLISWAIFKAYKEIESPGKLFFFSNLGIGCVLVL